MVFGFIMFGLTILVAVGTPFMLKRIDEGSVRPKSQNKQSKTNSRKALSLKEFLGIQDIKNQVVFLSNNRCRCILKIDPCNFDLLSEEEQTSIEETLRAAVKALDFPVQFFCTTELIDTRIAIKQLQQNTLHDRSTVRTEYADVLLNYLDMLMSQKAVLVRSTYAVIPCNYETTVEKALGVLDQRALQLINSLKNAKITATLLSSEEIVDLLFKIMNRQRMFRPSEAIQQGALDLTITGRDTNVSQKTQGSKAS
jgi:hypothetical protein